MKIIPRWPTTGKNILFKREIACKTFNNVIHKILLKKEVFTFYPEILIVIFNEKNPHWPIKSIKE